MNTGVSAKPKRFYKSVCVAQLDGAWGIELDGRIPKTPARADLSVPSEALAREIAKEWDDQSEVIDLFAMPLTRLANTAIDRARETRVAMIDELIKYLETDLVCYLADGPSSLYDAQEREFAAVRAWLANTHDISLLPTRDVTPISQDADALHNARQLISATDNFTVTGLASAAPLFGSTALALAIYGGFLTAKQAFVASIVDDIWQMEQWGKDEEAAARLEAQGREADGIGKWLAALADL